MRSRIILSRLSQRALAVPAMVSTISQRTLATPAIVSPLRKTLAHKPFPRINTLPRRDFYQGIADDLVTGCLLGVGSTMAIVFGGCLLLLAYEELNNKVNEYDLLRARKKSLELQNQENRDKLECESKQRAEKVPENIQLREQVTDLKTLLTFANHSKDPYQLLTQLTKAHVSKILKNLNLSELEGLFFHLSNRDIRCNRFILDTLCLNGTTFARKNIKDIDTLSKLITLMVFASPKKSSSRYDLINTQNFSHDHFQKLFRTLVSSKTLHEIIPDSSSLDILKESLVKELGISKMGLAHEVIKVLSDEMEIVPIKHSLSQ